MGRKNTRKIGGGIPKPRVTHHCTEKVDYRGTYTENDISNIDMLLFVFKLLGNDSFRKRVIIPNANFLNSLTPDNFDTYFAMTNASFRTFLNNLIQWLLLDYNQVFFNSVLMVLIRSFERSDFFNNPDPFNVILYELDVMITENKVDIDNTTLLKIILEVLTVIPSLSMYFQMYFKNAENITRMKKYLDTILCILKQLIQMDIHKNEAVRELITKFFSDKNPGLTASINAFGKVLRNCAGSFVKAQVSPYFSWFSQPNTPVDSNDYYKEHATATE